MINELFVMLTRGGIFSLFLHQSGSGAEENALQLHPLVFCIIGSANGL